MIRPLHRFSVAGRWTGSFRTVVALAVALAFCLMFPRVSAQADGTPGNDARASLPPSLRIDLDGANPQARLSVDGNGVVLPRDGSAVTFTLHLYLPPVAADAPPWLLRFNRTELKTLQLSAPGRGTPDWSPPAQDFFHPNADDGTFPMAFLQRLPQQWSGTVDVRVTAAADLVRTLRPQLMNAIQSVEQDKRNLAVVAALYACLVVLATVGLTLLLGARQPVFLSYLGLVGACFLEVLVVKDHAFSWLHFTWLASLGAQSLNLSMCLICASGTLVVRDYVDGVVRMAGYRRAALAWVLLLLLGAVACALNLAPPAWMPGAITAAWIITESLCALGITAATLRAAWLGMPLLVAMLPLGLSSVLFELSVRGLASEFWSDYGYLVGLMLMCLLLVVGMIGSVSDFRLRHEEEKQAREASETELARQVALSGLGQELRQVLQLVGPRDMHTVATQLALTRLIPLLRLKSASVVLYRRGEGDARVIEPGHYEERIRLLMEANAAKLRSLVQWQSPVARLDMVGPSRALLPGVTFGGVPIAIERGDQGVLLIEREGEQPFDIDDLTVAMDFSELALEYIAEARAAQKLRRNAELDALTEVLNRSAIDEQLEQAFEHAYLRQQALGVLFVDLDHFKSINDTHGHACGDYCLRALADILRGVLRAGDHLGRYGGEEFLVLLPGCDGAQAVELGERLRRAVENGYLHWQGRDIHLTISVGVSTRGLYEDKPAAAVARADSALYAAKNAGRNRVQLAS